MDTELELTQYGHRFFFSIILSTCLRNDLHDFKINLDILFHSPSIAVISERVFGWEVAFALFSGLKSCLIAILPVFSLT